MISVAFVGLSHLGINYSLATAAKGHQVVAYDPNTELCQNLAQGIFPVVEPGLAELHAAHRKRIIFSSQPADLQSCQLVFFSLDITTDENNRSNLQPIEELIQSTRPHLPPDCLVVVLSQVTPGFTRRLVDRMSKEGAGQIPPVYYQVETLIFGRAVERALNPERYIIGCEDPSKPLPSVYRTWLESFECPILPMRYESAELAKIAINFFLVSSVTTSNTLAELCERIGADWSEIQPTLRLDARIGPKAYLSPGLGLAGGNLERDLETFISLARQAGTDWRPVEAWQANSEHRRGWAIRMLSQHLPSATSRPQLAIWGLAYKENTHSTKNSASLLLLEAIPHLEKKAYDPQVRIPLGTYPCFTQMDAALDCCREADALVIMTPWPEFKNASIRQLKTAMRGRLILDPYGMLDAGVAKAEGMAYFRLGA